MLHDWQAADSNNNSAEMLAELHSLEPEQRIERLVSYLQSVLSEHLDVAIEDIGRRDRFVDLGIESTSAVEISMRLAEDVSPSVTQTVIFDYPTIELLSVYLHDEVFPKSENPFETSNSSNSNDPISRLDELSADEIENLLADEIGT